MIDIFPKALEVVLKHEGIYSDDQYDSGGKTKFGITQEVAKANGYTANMKDMPLSLAEFIYKKDYWDKVNLDEVSAYSIKVAIEVFESGVNCGIYTSAKWLQECINVLCDDFSVLVVDGVIGAKTITKLNTLKHYLDISTLVKMLNVCQGLHYMTICRRRSSQKKFIRGWFNRVNYDSIDNYMKVV